MSELDLDKRKNKILDSEISSKFKSLGFENLIGKATGQFIETHLHGNLSDLSKSEKLDEIKRLKLLQAERIEGVSPNKLIENNSDK